MIKTKGNYFASSFMGRVFRCERMFRITTLGTSYQQKAIETKAHVRNHDARFDFSLSFRTSKLQTLDR